MAYIQTILYIPIFKKKCMCDYWIYYIQLNTRTTTITTTTLSLSLVFRLFSEDIYWRDEWNTWEYRIFAKISHRTLNKTVLVTFIEIRLKHHLHLYYWSIKDGKATSASEGTSKISRRQFLEFCINLLRVVIQDVWDMIDHNAAG